MNAPNLKRIMELQPRMPVAQLPTSMGASRVAPLNGLTKAAEVAPGVAPASTSGLGGLPLASKAGIATSALRLGAATAKFAIGRSALKKQLKSARRDLKKGSPEARAREMEGRRMLAARTQSLRQSGGGTLAEQQLRNQQIGLEEARQTQGLQTARGLEEAQMREGARQEIRGLKLQRSNLNREFVGELAGVATQGISDVVNPLIQQKALQTEADRYAEEQKRQERLLELAEAKETREGAEFEKDIATKKEIQKTKGEQAIEQIEKEGEVKEGIQETKGEQKLTEIEKTAQEKRKSDKLLHGYDMALEELKQKGENAFTTPQIRAEVNSSADNLRASFFQDPLKGGEEVTTTQKYEGIKETALRISSETGRDFKNIADWLSFETIGMSYDELFDMKTDEEQK